MDRRTSSQKKLNNNKATTKLTRFKKRKYKNFAEEKIFLLVIRYSFDEFRRILVEENTLIESNEPIIPTNTKNIKLRCDHFLTNNNKNNTRIKTK
jgi:hypothetical protein